MEGGLVPRLDRYQPKSQTKQHPPTQGGAVQSSSPLRTKLTTFLVAKLAPQVLAPGSQLYDEVGTSGWTAPEVFSDSGYGLEADVWSFGVLLWELLSGAFDYVALAIC